MFATQPRKNATYLLLPVICIVLIAFGLYLVAFTCAGLLSSSLTHHSATSFVLLLTFWVATGVVLPRLSLIAAHGFRPAPSIHEYQARRNAVFSQYSVKWREVRRQWDQEHAQPGREWWRTPEGREARYFHYIESRKERDKQRQPALSHIDEDFRNRFNARLSLAVTLARLSPAFVLKNAVIRLTGTGIDRHQRFEQAFEVYYTERYYDWLFKASDLDNFRRAHPEKYGKPRWDISDMPRFTYWETWPKEDLQAALIDVRMLVLWGMVFFAGAYVKMLRYDVR